jgi:hypothetical protein
MNAPSIIRMLLITALGLSQPALSAQGQPQAPTASTAPKAPAIRVPDALVNPITPDDANETTQASEAPAQALDPAAYRAAVKRANAAVSEQDWPNAARHLEEVLALKPDSKEAAYNLGVARFQQGDFAGARKMFQQSAQNAPADLAARSMYNEGNSIYADAVRNLPPIDPASRQGQPQQPPAVPPEELQKAVQQVEQAFTHFKDAAAANPGDEDSAANAETALKLLKELRKVQQQQQQQQQQQKSSGKPSQDPNEAPQSQPDQQNEQRQEPPSKPQQSDSKNDQKPEPKQDASQQKDERPDTKPDPKQDSNSKDQQQQQQQQQQPNEQQQPPQQGQQQAQGKKDASAKQGEGPGAEAVEERMDQTQADRLLQLVRDKEKSRNAQRKAEQARTRSTPVDRDW